ncbi:MAG: hypothetical protein IPP47_32265 [Bryobacterales bacterium]|nr:hypothetical protein [Bryobacterales bacterium]
MTLRTFSALGAAFFLALAIAPAQDKKLACEDKSQGDNRRNRVCEMRESTIAANGKLAVDAAPNGGIRIAGWDKNEILVRAKVEAWGDSDAEARGRLTEVRIATSGNSVKADGPKSSGNWGGNQKWSVSYEVFVPKKIDLKLDTVNGGINVADVRGNMKFQTVNGGVTLARMAGMVRGETVNGGVHVDLAGNTWEGEGLELETVNGGVTVAVPAAYSASFHAGTVNGGMNSDFEGASIQGKHGPKKMDLKLGAGGPTVRLETVNGGVKIRRKA